MRYVFAFSFVVSKGGTERDGCSELCRMPGEEPGERSLAFACGELLV